MSSLRTVTEQLPLKSETPRWFAFRTMYKREKMVSKRMNSKGIESYVPLKTEVRHYKSKTSTVQLPLFSSYVFVRLTAHEYTSVLMDDDVFEIVKFQGEVGRVTEQEITFLKTILREDSEIQDVEIYDGLLPGSPIVISGGTLAGTRGFIVDHKDNNNFVVELQTLGVSLRMSVNQTSIAPEFGRQHSQVE